MVPDEIEPAEGVGRAPHDAAGEFVLAQIADQAERAPARAGDLADHGIDARLIDVDDPDRGTFAGEAKRTGPPHPRGRRSTGGFDRLPRTRCAICRCSRRPKGRSWSRTIRNPGNVG
jgi:hypothetical protein